MRNAAEYADHPCGWIGMCFGGIHAQKAECRSTEAVEDPEGVSEQHADDQNAQCRDKCCLFQRITHQNIEHGKICQSELYPGDSGKDREQ